VTALVAGLVLTGIVTTILHFAFGHSAMLPAAVFGLLATGIQVAAAAIRRRSETGSFERSVHAFAAGFGLRLLGVALMTAAILARRDLFPPLPTALGFLGVTIPLLFMEIRPAR
jgi:hypothetical protein